MEREWGTRLDSSPGVCRAPALLQPAVFISGCDSTCSHLCRPWELQWPELQGERSQKGEPLPTPFPQSSHIQVQTQTQKVAQAPPKMHT